MVLVMAMLVVVLAVLVLMAVTVGGGYFSDGVSDGYFGVSCGDGVGSGADVSDSR